MWLHRVLTKRKPLVKPTRTWLKLIHRLAAQWSQSHRQPPPPMLKYQLYSRKKYDYSLVQKVVLVYIANPGVTRSQDGDDRLRPLWASEILFRNRRVTSWTLRPFCFTIWVSHSRRHLGSASLPDNRKWAKRQQVGGAGCWNHSHLGWQSTCHWSDHALNYAEL